MKMRIAFLEEERRTADLLRGAVEVICPGVSVKLVEDSKSPFLHLYFKTELPRRIKKRHGVS